jgi:hypothetical protein
MKAIEKYTTSAQAKAIPEERDYQLIDLFVDMCFYDIDNPAVIFQFKVLASNLNYTASQTNKVVEIGRKEYVRLFNEIEEQILGAVSG